MTTIAAKTTSKVLRQRRIVGAGAAVARQPGPRTLLVGTSLSVTQLQHTLAVADPAPAIIGALVAAGGDAARLPMPLLGDFSALDQCLAGQQVEQVFVSLPLAMAAQARTLIQQLQQRGITWRFLPTIGDQLAGRVRIRMGSGEASSGADLATPPFLFDPMQLLNRRPHPLDEAMIRKTIRGRVVLITGAGGSIGSELARQVGRFEPAQLVLIERAENAMFEIDRQIRELYPAIHTLSRMHDVTDAAGTQELVESLRPDVIFHAAAHKHVPMMEEHPSQAVENNFYGTRSIAEAADRCGVGVFVMISTDKAVNPRSIMGATKRLAELYIQSLNAISKTNFCMVRFGNVLGSNASVLPIWMQQLAKGGPITVTHPEMSRYFMTIPEAAGLVLQSGAISQNSDRGGGEVFLLDMGEPIRIVELARRFIRSQGFEPDVDVKIDFTGIRPGEKLFEELVYGGEDMLPTEHASIRIWRTQPPDPRRMAEAAATFDRLRAAKDDHGAVWHRSSREAIVEALMACIPEMVRDGEKNQGL